MAVHKKLTRRALLQAPAATAGAVVVGTALPAQAAGGEAHLLDDFPPTVQDLASSLYRATNQTYGTASTSGSYSDCAVVFTAPPTGRVIIHWSGAPRNIHAAGLAVAYISPEVRAGGSIGSGSVILGAADTRSVRTNLTDSTTVRAGASHMLAGLVPGNTYNARILHRVTSQTGEFFHRGIIVAPAT